MLCSHNLSTQGQRDPSLHLDPGLLQPGTQPTAHCLEVAAAVKVVAVPDTGLEKQDTFTCESHQGPEAKLQCENQSRLSLFGEPPPSPSLFYCWAMAQPSRTLQESACLPTVVGRGYAPLPPRGWAPWSVLQVQESTPKQGHMQRDQLLLSRPQDHATLLVLSAWLPPSNPS